MGFQESMAMADGALFEEMGESIQIGGVAVQAVRQPDDVTSTAAEGGFAREAAARFEISMADFIAKGVKLGQRVQQGAAQGRNNRAYLRRDKRTRREGRILIMDEVMGLLESELAALFTQDAVVDCPVLPGASAEERPDEYVSIVAVESEYRAARSYIVEAEFRCVVPLDDAGALGRAKQRLRQVTDFLAGNALRQSGQAGAGPVTLALAGFVMRSLSSQTGERSRAEIARVRFGVSASS